jgi:hypothetical protein
MSGCSSGDDCPRCLGKGTLEVYSDWKPFDQTTGQCLRCGFTYYYKYGIIKKEELKEELKERHEYYEDEELLKEFAREFTKEELEEIKEFDEMYGVEK